MLTNVQKLMSHMADDPIKQRPLSMFGKLYDLVVKNTLEMLLPRKITNFLTLEDCSCYGLLGGK